MNFKVNEHQDNAHFDVHSTQHSEKENNSCRLKIIPHRFHVPLISCFKVYILNCVLDMSEFCYKGI